MNGSIFLKELGITESFQSFVMVTGLIMARVLPVFILNPFLGGKIMPRNVKVGLSILVAILVYKPVKASFTHPIPLDMTLFMALLVKELIFGFAIGYISSLVFYGIQAAGRVLDQARGSTMGTMLAPQTGGMVSHFGQLQFQFSIVLFFLINGHHLFLRAIFRSFQLVPVDDFPSFVKISTPSIHLIGYTSGQVITIALLLAAPPLVAIFMSDLVFGVINRVAPQVNVFFMSMPVKMMVGLVVMFFVFGFLADQMRWHFINMLNDVNHLIKIF